MIDYTSNADWTTPTHLGRKEKLSDDEKSLNYQGATAKIKVSSS